MLPITIRKRTISEADLPLIQTIVDRHWDKGRKHISKILCQEWHWRQPNGRLKDMACRELLLTLSRKGLINLPPRLISAHNDKRNRSIPIVEIEQTPLQGKASEFQPISLQLVRNTTLEPLYNSLIEQHHYLGYRQIVGLRLVEPTPRRGIISNTSPLSVSSPLHVWDGDLPHGPSNPGIL